MTTTQKTKNKPKAPTSRFAMKRILVPTDFSEAGKAALIYAKSLAQLTGASVCLMHVTESPYPGGDFALAQADLIRAREKVNRQLGALQMGEFQSIKTTFAMREGIPFQEIITTAKREKCDLIVMATHGYTGLQHILLGSTTERVVRHATCPVLVVRSESSKPAKARKKSRS